MDDFLALVGVQAMRYAIRSGIALTSTYALGQCSRLLKTVGDTDIIAELKSLRNLLDSKIKIISPAIDLIEFKSSRGNVFLESAAPLAKSLHREIVSLGRQIEFIASAEEDAPPTANGKFRVTQHHRDGLLGVISSIKQLLDRIDREIPLLQLAISASGESLSTSLPTGISPSRLLQASTFLIIGDTQFAKDPSRPVQIGPAFTLSLYMLFLGHASHQFPARGTSSPRQQGASNPDIPKGVYGLGDSDRKPLWQEVLHKARVRLCRTQRDYVFDGQTGYRPKTPAGEDSPERGASYGHGGGGEYSYHLEIIEDLDDGRVHDDEKKSRPYDDIANAGIRESLPIYQLSKIFYTDTGRILNIGNTSDGDNHPVLLLKRDIHAVPTGRTAGLVAHYLQNVEDEDEASTRFQDDVESCDRKDTNRQLRQKSAAYELEGGESQTPIKRTEWGFPSHLDPEWIALEVFEEDDDTGDLDDDSESATEDGLPRSMLQSPGNGRHRSSLDSRMIEQIKKLSLGPSSVQSSTQLSPSSPSRDPATDTTSMRDFVARSPFGTITTSLSLMEMLIRLTSLQEVQQASHLSIPDHILTFFLEETSTTGLVGETQRRARSEAKRRMGFDPYTDTSESRADE